MLTLSRLVSVKHRRRTQDACCTADGSAASQARRKDPSCRHGESAKRRKTSQLTLDRLPQDILHQILALLPMQDAARTACVSRELSHSWRYYPELEFSAKTLALCEQHTSIQGQMATDILKRIDDAMQNRAGVWVKRLKFELLFLLLETFILHVEESAVEKTHLAIDPSKIIELPKRCHENIKHVKITGFGPIQELVELVFYILENAVMLQCLTLDYRIHGFEKVLLACIAQDIGTRDYQEWCNNYGDNEDFRKYMRREDPDPYWVAYLSHIALSKYILGRVPASVELKILGVPPDEVISSLSALEK
ncbi:hypothetical protein QOZ80_1AG0022220 [Eleusine coracana subsp. coracana]|nr:hypothetical protein QOZ80_1AG0022220 [Eleusine coracana subsp. coracana]